MVSETGNSNGGETRVIAQQLALTAKDCAARVAVAESLTGGQVCAELARTPDAGEWFVGGVVAYLSQVKYDLLGVPPGPVVS